MYNADVCILFLMLLSVRISGAFRKMSKRSYQRAFSASTHDYTLKFDGGSRGNPGVGGSGAVIYRNSDGELVFTGCRYLGDGVTNNQAEYQGLILGLEALLDKRLKGTDLRVDIQGDSLLVINQIQYKWKVKNEVLKSHHATAVDLLAHLNSWTATHIPREENGRADKLANDAMSLQQDAQEWSKSLAPSSAAVPPAPAQPAAVPVEHIFMTFKSEASPVIYAPFIIKEQLGSNSSHAKIMDIPCFTPQGVNDLSAELDVQKCTTHLSRCPPNVLAMHVTSPRHEADRVADIGCKGADATDTTAAAPYEHLSKLLMGWSTAGLEAAGLEEQPQQAQEEVVDIVWKRLDDSEDVANIVGLASYEEHEGTPVTYSPMVQGIWLIQNHRKVTSKPS